MNTARASHWPNTNRGAARHPPQRPRVFYARRSAMVASARARKAAGSAATAAQLGAGAADVDTGGTVVTAWANRKDLRTTGHSQ